MTEKQYKGIAGNFLICDVQKEYAEHLLSILVKRFGMRFQFHFFSNVKKIEQFAEKAEIEILLIAEDCVSEIRGNVKAKKKFILSESMKKEEKQGETTIFRYQSADEILKIIQSGIGEEEAKAAKIKAEDEKYMKEAIKQAKKAAKIGDVPIGCVLVKDGQVIARGYNRRNADKTVLSHAEVTSIKKACKKEGDWRLEDCTLYVTLEPCPMCAGAIVQARIPRVVTGSMNSKAGCAGSVLNLLKEPGFNHQAQVVTGILEEECSEMMSSFFTELRKKKRLPETP